MTIATTLMSLLKAQGSDNARDYLKTSLAATLDKIDAQNHDGGAGGAAVAKLAVTQASTVTGVTITGSSAILNNFSLTNTSVDPTDNLPWVWNRQTLGAPATTLVTPSIPAGWSQIEIVGQLRSDYAGAVDKIGLRFNADNTAGHYNGGYTYNDNTTPAKADSAFNQAQAMIGRCACTGAAGGGFAAFRLTIPSYANAAYNKGAACYGMSWEFGTLGNVAVAFQGGGSWNQTAAITTVTLFPINGANWLAGSMWTVTLVP